MEADVLTVPDQRGNTYLEGKRILARHRVVPVQGNTARLCAPPQRALLCGLHGGSPGGHRYSSSHMDSQMCPGALWPRLLVLVLLCVSGVRPGKCPQQCVCDQIQLTVACVNKNLTQVPPTVDEITVKLDLRGNNIQELPTGAFKHTPYLTHLSLQRCNIRTVKEGAFRSLGRLVFLNLANNNIEILYQESFDGLSSLKQLMIDRNRVEEIQPGAFSQLGFLNLLSLTHNQLVYIPNMAFQGLQNIKWLRLSYNSLNYLDTEAFAGLFTLTRLSLDHNELQFFPTDTMTRLPEVTRLDLSYNPMTYLGEEVVSMAKLTHLFLDHMSLQDMANTAISKSPSLTHLDLSHNQLRVIQPFSAGSPKLARLHLAGNPVYCNCYLRPLREWALRGKVKLVGACAGPAHFSGENLEAIHPADLRCQSQEAMLKAEFEEATRVTPPPTEGPENKVKCPANCACEVKTHHSSCENRGHTKVPRGFSPDMRLLDLRGNHFHYLPGNSFPGVPQVVSLHLQRCKIVEVEGGAFNGMKGLVYLYLSENDLTSLSPDAFKGLPQLTYLHLEKNRFTSFPKGAFKLLPGLLALHLEDNAINKLEPEALTGTEGLRGLYLTGNSIDYVSPRALDQASHLDTLHLGGNKLKDVPTDALSKAENLGDLRLSGNLIRWVGPNAFQSLARSLKNLYLDNMGLEKMSKNSLGGLGPGLRSLFLEGNQLEEVPDLHPLTSLEVINLADNPLLCDCPLLPLRMWIEKVNLKVRATCANPPELKGRRVKDVHIFKACPGGESLPSSTALTTKLSKAPKSTKPKPAHLNGPRQVKILKVKSKPRKTQTPKPAAAKKTTERRRLA
ncbi:chondroadherin-like b [Diretmus argenteus]